LTLFPEFIFSIGKRQRDNLYNPQLEQANPFVGHVLQKPESKPIRV